MQPGMATNGSDIAMKMDRRTADRFPINEEIRYRVLDLVGEKKEGAGMTLDMSRGGVLFTTDEHLDKGRLVELSVNWPAQLNGTCPLQLVAAGHVIRSTAESAVVRIERYEFRTRRKDRSVS